MAVQINLAMIREKYPELVSEFSAIQRAINTQTATPAATTTTTEKQ